MFKFFLVYIILVLTSVVTLEGVTVNPLCPTNKIAPHRRNVREPHYNGRTFGAFYDLLGPQNANPNNPGTLQEEPQNDEPDDCGDIEDYDENDLSSVTPKLMRRNDVKIYGPLSMLFHHFHGPVATTSERYRPTRPPTGGYFGNNGYRPPKPQEPSDYIKPVAELNENGNGPSLTYRPTGLVGVPINQIVGATQVVPFSSETTTHYFKPRYTKFNNRVTTTPITRIREPRKYNSDSSILGSFIDLLFK